jgi:hypothetical protein
MNFATFVDNTFDAVATRDVERLTRELGGLNQFPATVPSRILPSLLRVCIYDQFNDGVSVLLKAGAKPCATDLFLAIQVSHAEMVKQLLTPELLEKLACDLSDESFEFAFQQIEMSHWNAYKSACSLMSKVCQTHLAFWMASKMSEQIQKNPPHP